MKSFHLETKHLRIRRPELSDLRYLLVWLTDPETSKHVGGVRPEAKIRETMERTLKNWEKVGFGRGILELKSTGEVVGLCGISEVQVDGRIENDLGYLIDKRFWGRGFATEASKAMMDYAINELGMKRITAWPSSKNIGSVRVAEKLGFKFEKEISEIQSDVLLEGMRLYVWTRTDELNK